MIVLLVVVLVLPNVSSTVLTFVVPTGECGSGWAVGLIRAGNWQLTSAAASRQSRPERSVVILQVGTAEVGSEGRWMPE